MWKSQVLGYRYSNAYKEKGNPDSLEIPLNSDFKPPKQEFKNV